MLGFYRGTGFRPCFKRLGELTAIFSDVPHLALTATATEESLSTIIEELQFQQPRKIIINPDRPNIFYEKKDRLPNVHKFEKFDELIHPLATELYSKRDMFPVTIVYVESLDSLGYLFEYLEHYMGDSAFIPQTDQVPENRIFAMFHKRYTQKMKEHIVSQLRMHTPKLRLILATVSLGMGLNAPSIERVIHFRPPTSIEAYMQESGRAGRSGQPAYACIYFNNSDIAANRPGITPQMQAFCKNNTTCLRLQLLRHFGFETPVYNGEKKNCCSVCRDYRE